MATRTRLTRRGKTVVTVLGAAAIVLPTAGLASAVTAPRLLVTGPGDGERIGAGRADAFAVRLGDEAEGATVALDGRPIDLEGVAGGGLEAWAGRLEDGEHVLEVATPRRLGPGARTEQRRFTVDRTPPELAVDVADAVPPGTATSLRGTTAGATGVTVDGREVDVADDGSFAAQWSAAPSAPVEVAAHDDVGNVAARAVRLPLVLPGTPDGPPVRAVHVSPDGWATDEIREPILAAVDEGRINTIELSLKSESGEVGYDTDVALAHELGAVTARYDLTEVVAQLHARGVRVIGRVVNFRDPLHAAWAVEQGRDDLVVQDPSGAPYEQYGGYTNIASPEVWEYSIALAEEATRLGVDDILYDYVRRPDGALSSMVFPGLEGQPEDAIVDFLAASADRVQAAGGELGASVFGVAATRPQEVAQDVPRMAEHLDYVAPMVYPSHWGPGEYGVASPDDEPGPIVQRSLTDFVEAVEGTDTDVVAWLQDFSLRRTYTDADVRAQVDATAAAGADGWILWNAAARYRTGDLDTDAGEPTTGVASAGR